MTNEEIAVDIAEIRTRLAPVEAGISNFRNFQSEMRGKLGFVYGAVWVAGIAGMVFLVILAWALHEVVPACRLVIDDYYHNHPASRLQQKTVVSPIHDPYTARITLPQIASH